MKGSRIPQIGERFVTNQGCEIEVVKYNTSSDVVIKFLDTGYEKACASKEVRNGGIKNPYFPFVKGVGFFGVGPHIAYAKGVRNATYTHWSSMLTRCYTEEYQQRFPTYIGCVVDEQWHNYQEFAEWYNWQVGSNKGYVLDKDLLGNGSKVYGPETCVLLPSDLNGLLVVPTKKGKIVPTGISFQKSSQKYIVSCAVAGKNKNLGRYICPDEAFSVYKAFKENLVRQKAEEYKDQIDGRAYHALMNFKVKG